MQVFLTPHHLAIVMECANGGTMRDYLLKQPDHRLPEVLGRWIFQQLIIGLDYCHARVRPAGSLSSQASSPIWQDRIASQQEAALQHAPVVQHLVIKLAHCHALQLSGSFFCTGSR